MKTRNMIVAIGSVACTYFAAKNMPKEKQNPIYVYEGSRDPLDQARITQARTRNALPFGSPTSYINRPVVIMPGNPPTAPTPQRQPGRS